MRNFWVNIGLILTLFFLTAPSAFAGVVTTSDDCVDVLIRPLTSAQTRTLEAGKKAVKQLREGRKWIHVTADIAFLRGELQRLASALTNAGASTHAPAKMLLDKINAWIELKNGSEIPLADYSVTSFQIVSVVDFLKYDYANPVSREQVGYLRPVNSQFKSLDFSFNGEAYVRLPYRSGVHPLVFFGFYFAHVILWETVLETRDTDGVQGLSADHPEGVTLQDIAIHDFLGHQNILFGSFRQDIIDIHTDYEYENDETTKEFQKFLKTIFTDLSPQDFKYQLFAYLLWYPVHEIGMPPTLNNILTHYEKGLYSATNDVGMRTRHSPHALFARFLQRITDTQNLGADFKQFRTDTDADSTPPTHVFKLDTEQIENVRDELLRAIRAFQKSE